MHYGKRMRTIAGCSTVVVGAVCIALTFGACTSFGSDPAPSAADPGSAPATTDGATEGHAPVTGVGVLDDAGRDAEAGVVEAGVDSSVVLEMHEFCVAEVNKHRAAAGVAPLARWGTNEACVDGQALSDYTAGRTHSNVTACTETGQAACLEWPSADPNASLRGCIQAMWDEGPGDFATHSNYETLAKTSFTKVACGIYLTPGGKLWAELDFN